MRRRFAPERVLSDPELCVSVASYVASFFDALLGVLAPRLPHSCCPATSSYLEGASCSALAITSFTLVVTAPGVLALLAYSEDMSISELVGQAVHTVYVLELN